MYDRKVRYAEMTVQDVVKNGMCIGCGACAGCKNISFKTGKSGFPVPVVGEGCKACGKCLINCPAGMGTDEDD